jgi:hypothetical protein
VADEGGFACAEEAGDDGDGDFVHGWESVGGEKGCNTESLVCCNGCDPPKSPFKRGTLNLVPPLKGGLGAIDHRCIHFGIWCEA